MRFRDSLLFECTWSPSVLGVSLLLFFLCIQYASAKKRKSIKKISDCGINRIDASSINHCFVSMVGLKQEGTSISQCPMRMDSAKIDVEADVYTSIAAYVSWLSKPNLNIRRKGPTCPYITRSINLDSVYLSLIRNINTEDQMVELLLSMIAEFQVLKPNAGANMISKALILLFPEISDENIPRLIDGCQKRLKPVFIKNGLMIGEFYRFNNTPSLRNIEFYPLRTKYPTLAIRHMVPSDVVFMNDNAMTTQVKIGMLETYIQRFEPLKEEDKGGDGGPHAKELISAKAMLLQMDQKLHRLQ